MLVADSTCVGRMGAGWPREVHRRLPQARKILLTGQAGLSAVTNVINRADLYRYIGKPWDREDLVMTVREAVRSYFREEEVRLTNAVTTRFVPHEFLRLLGRERLVDVSRRDHIQLEMHVLFTDIRGYTTIVEGQSGAENFAFINEYLIYMEPPLAAHGGFIDHYAGDGSLVLFPGSADEALRAGIESFGALERYNAHRAEQGRGPVSIGAGLNSGTLMLGIIGGTDRLSAGVIGDPVNLGARLESLTKQLGARFLISGYTRARLADPEEYDLRHVDRVRVKGRLEPVEVYEVLDVLDADVRSRRLHTRERLQSGREAFVAGRFEEALATFEAALTDDPEDAVLAIHIQRCKHLQREGVSAGWEGVVDLEIK
jgi:class 3 adenylate cyclase